MHHQPEQSLVAFLGLDSEKSEEEEAVVQEKERPTCPHCSKIFKYKKSYVQHMKKQTVRCLAAEKKMKLRR